MSYEDSDHPDNSVTAGDAPTPETQRASKDDQVEHPSDQSEHQAGDNPAAERAGIYDKPSEEEQAEIAAERERRLDSANRPEHAEVDNSDAELPTVEAFDAEHAGEESVGTSDPSRAFREMEVPEEEQRQMADERERRLDPDNRPDGAEVDNTSRKFEEGRFVD